MKSLLLLLLIQILIERISTEDIRLEFFRSCNLLRHSTVPNEYDKPMTPIVALSTFTFGQLVDVVDVEETFTLVAGIDFHFIVPCLAKQAMIKNSSGAVVPEKWIISNIKDYWKPPLVQQNSRFDYGLTEDVSAILQTTPFNGDFHYTISGSFTSNCEMDFHKFPFDKQSCTLDFFLFLDSSMVNLTMFAPFLMENGTTFISDNMGWELVNVSTSFQTAGFQNTQFYSLTASLNIKRRPSYFIINVIAPSYIVTAVQLAAFFVPPESPDRSSFAVTILLAFTVIQGNILNYIPKTPQNVLLNSVILFDTIMAMIVTFHSVITCAFVDSFDSIAQRKFKWLSKAFHPRLIRIIDLIMFTSVFILLVTVNMAVMIGMNSD